MSNKKLKESISAFNSSQNMSIHEAYKTFVNVYKAGATLADEYKTLEMSRDNWRKEAKDIRRAIHEHYDNVNSGMDPEQANILLWREINK